MFASMDGRMVAECNDPRKCGPPIQIENISNVQRKYEIDWKGFPYRGLNFQ
jgi:hypothetical protein